MLKIKGWTNICQENGRLKESKGYSSVTKEWNSDQKPLKQDKEGQFIMQIQ